MSTTAQLQAFHTADFTANQRKVYAAILANPNRNAKQIARVLGWEINSITGRISELKKSGWVIGTDAKGGETLQAITDAAECESIRQAYEEQQFAAQVRRLQKTLNKLRPNLTAAEIQKLRPIVNRLKDMA